MTRRPARPCSRAPAALPATRSSRPASTGTIGPNLDDLAEYAQKAGQPLSDFTLSAITTPPPKYVPPGFPTNAMPSNFGQTLSPKQLADLVAFLDAGA